MHPFPRLSCLFIQSLKATQGNRLSCTALWPARDGEIHGKAKGHLVILHESCAVSNVKQWLMALIKDPPDMKRLQVREEFQMMHDNLEIDLEERFCVRCIAILWTALTRRFRVSRYKHPFLRCTRLLLSHGWAILQGQIKPCSSRSQGLFSLRRHPLH